MSEDQDIPSPKLLKQLLPITKIGKEKISQFRTFFSDILINKDPRKFVIIGPCSIHSYEGASTFATWLQKQMIALSDNLFFVMRCHVEKPRTAIGWKGFVYDPDLNGKYDLKKGLLLSRKLMTHLVQLDIPISMEILDPFLAPYFDDLLTHGVIGSRTVTSQIHRQIASQDHFPIGIKNALDGNLQAAIHAMQVAYFPQHFFGISQLGHLSQIHSKGNHFTHIILRGGYESNLTAASVEKTIKLLKDHGLNTKIVLDIGHGNCQKKLEKLLPNFESALKLMMHYNEICGIMMESYVYEGRQSLKSLPISPFISITDPCMDLTNSEKCLNKLHSYSTLCASV